MTAPLGALLRLAPGPDRGHRLTDAAPSGERGHFQQDLWHYTLAKMVDACAAAGIKPFYGPVGAARRLGLSASAMSRMLARLRAATGDPLLVRAGRGLVPTPRAVELRDRVRETTDEALALLRPAIVGPDLSALERTFTIRANYGFVETFGARPLAALTDAAPGVRLRFAPKPDKDVRRYGRASSTLRLAFSARQDRRCAFSRFSRIDSWTRCARATRC